MIHVYISYITVLTTKDLKSRIKTDILTNYCTYSTFHDTVSKVRTKSKIAGNAHFITALDSLHMVYKLVCSSIT